MIGHLELATGTLALHVTRVMGVAVSRHEVIEVRFFSDVSERI